MSKLKIKNLLRLIGSLILVVVLALTVVACDSTPDNDDAGASDEEIITPVRNGEFIYFDDTKTPYAPSSWTLSSTYSVDKDDDTVYSISGVIDTNADKFGAMKDDYNITTNPGKVGADDFVLMINNLKPYAANYKSTAITLEEGKFYKLTLSVKTASLTENNGGANVKLSTSGSRDYLAFKSLKNTEWVEYTFYLESKKTASTTVYLNLSLGYGDENDDATIAKGSAFFDNVVLTAYTDIEGGATAEEQYNADSDASTNADWTDDTHATYDFSLPNREFDNKNVTSSASSTATPYDWSTKRGTDENGDFQASTSGLTRGIIDVTAYTPTKGFLKDNPDITAPANSKGNNVLMIYFTDPASPSAFAYYSNSITFESEKTYKLSFYVRTLGIKDKDGKTVADGGKQVGVAIKLGDELLFEDVNTNGDWVQYSVYVKGSTTQDVSRSLYFWLGQGYKGNEDDFASGAAFFDCITMTEVDFPATITDTEYKIDLHSENEISGNAFESTSTEPTYVKTPDNWEGSYAPDHGNPVDGVVFGSIDLNNYDNNGQIDATNPGLASNTRAGSNVALVIDANKASHYIVDYKNALDVYANTSYRLSFWVKTEGIALDNGIKIDLINKNADDESSEVLSSLTSINTQYEDDDKDTDVLLNKWVEVVFSVHGHQIEDNQIGVRITLGSGNKYSPNYINGTIFMSNMYYETINLTEYNAITSGETVANYTFRTESNAPVRNSGFNYIDIDKTAKTDSLVNGHPTNSPAVPEYWTGSHVNDLAGEVVSGIVNSTVHANLGFSEFTYDSGKLNAYSAYNGEPNLLMIWAKDETAFSYTSQSHTLNASSFYKISANVKTNLDSGDAYFSILSGNKVIKSDAINTTGISGASNEDGWTTYNFYVKVGLNSASVKFVLSLGFDEASLAKGQVYFDNVTYKQITGSQYADAVESNTSKKLSLTTNSFETISESYPATPSNFNGGAISGAPAGSSYTVSGIVSKNHYDLDEMEAEFGETIKAHYQTGKFTGANDTPEFLIIYNKEDTAYRYVSTSYSLTSETYYRVSFWAKTLALGEGDYAYAILSLTDSDTLTIKIDPTTAVTPDDNGWAKYVFYVKTADYDVTGVDITFGLGEYEKDDSNVVITDKYAKGYAMFDEVTIEDIEEDVYTSETQNITAETLNAKEIKLIYNSEKDPESGKEDEDTTTPLTTWEIVGIVSGAMLSVALVAVLVIAFAKKVSPRIKAKKTKRFKKPTYDKRKSSVANRDKLNKYKD